MKYVQKNNVLFTSCVIVVTSKFPKLAISEKSHHIERASSSKIFVASSVKGNIFQGRSNGDASNVWTNW